MRAPRDFEPDVIVVGSGATGAMAAYVLTRAGAKVLMLEAGRDYDPASETAMLHWAHQAPLRAVATPQKPFGFYDATVDGGWEVPGEPYTKAEGAQFLWWRARMLGGRTNHWARHVPRFGPYDFKPRSRDGLGVDWPISYEDVAPYMDRVERLIGVHGAPTGLENHPDSPPGILHAPPPPRAPELLLMAACADLAIPCAPSRRAILTRDMPDPHAPRSACYYASDCERGCSIGAAFQTTTSLLPMAMATGRLRIVTDAMVHAVRTDARGRASGVAYFDKSDGGEHIARARAVILAASACESARILMLSNQGRGLANSSGELGRNLTDTPGASVVAQIPALEARPRYNEDGNSMGHVYIPWWLYREQRAGELNFPRGYHYEVGTGFAAPDGNFGLGGDEDGYGAALKQDVRRFYGSLISLHVRGEMIPNAHSYCELDPEVKDRFGLPVLRFHWKWSDYEYNQVAHGLATARRILERMGGRVLSPELAPQDAMKAGGELIHEIGTARMSETARDGVTNQYCQTWDIDNLFVVDGGVFASNAHKNPTLTMMAIAWRASDHIAERLGRNEL